MAFVGRFDHAAHFVMRPVELTGGFAVLTGCPFFVFHKGVRE